MTNNWAGCYMCNHIFATSVMYHRHSSFCKDAHWDHFEGWKKKFKIGGLTIKEYNEIRTRTK